jgi:uncharacterized protein YraI
MRLTGVVLMMVSIVLNAAPAAAADAASALPLTARGVPGFVPKGWVVVSGAQVAADIDGDGRADLAFLLQNPDMDRLLVVALNTGSGYRRIAAGSGPVVMPDHQPSLTFAKGVLTLEQVTDGPTPIMAAHRFRYEAAAGRMRLIGEDIESYTRPLRRDTHKTSTNWLTGERVVEIGVEKGGTIAETRSFKSRVPVRTLYLEDVTDPHEVLSEAMKPHWKSAAPAAAAAPAAEVQCDIAAEVIDKDPKGLNVRAGPDTKHPVIAVIPAGQSAVVGVSAARGPWMRVKWVGDGNEDKDFSKRTAWVYGPLLGFELWARHPQKTVPMRAAPDEKAPVLANLPIDREAVLTGCQGRWAKARYEGREGWFAPEHRCANPFTVCN